MSKKEQKLDWFAIDTKHMKADCKALLDEFLALQKKASLARQEFETAYTIAARNAEALDKECEFRFAYKYGPSIAKVPKESKAEQSSKKQMFSF
jgi:hypothetical protein